MTDTPGTDARLAALETGATHQRELSRERSDQIWRKLAELDTEIEKLQQSVAAKIGGIYKVLWGGLVWLTALLASTLLTIALKVSGVF